jgi:serine/threonine-protein kinase
MALHVAIESAWGVDAAHEIGVIHRDIKPDNIWLTPDGLVKVLDFSLAKVIPEGVTTTVQLGAVTGLGTVAYLAPEGLRTDADVDARVDVYALGLMLWQMIAGRHPFQDALRNTTELMRRQLFVDPEPLSAVAGLPAYVDELMRRALAKKREDRFCTMAEMARALMTLRDRLRAAAEQGLIDISVPYGEPPIPSAEPWARKDYQGPRLLPERAQPRPQPEQRVVVSPEKAKAARAERAAKGGTLRLRTDHAAPGTGTAPLPAHVLARDADALAQMAAGVPLPPMVSPQRPAGDHPGTPSRETPPAVEPGPVQRSRGPRSPAVFVALLLGSAALVSAGTLRWRRGSVAPPATSALVPTSASSATPLSASAASSPPSSAPSGEPPPQNPAAAELQPEPNGPTANPTPATIASAVTTAPTSTASIDAPSRSRTTGRARPSSPRPVLPAEPPSRRPFGIED